MSLRQLGRYLDMIPELEAREHLTQVQVQAFPYLKAEDRREVLKALYSQLGLKATTGPRVGWDNLGSFIGKK